MYDLFAGGAAGSINSYPPVSTFPAVTRITKIASASRWHCASQLDPRSPIKAIGMVVNMLGGEKLTAIGSPVVVASVPRHAVVN
jgi:hypothetical protein